MFSVEEPGLDADHAPGEHSAGLGAGGGDGHWARHHRPGDTRHPCCPLRQDVLQVINILLTRKGWCPRPGRGQRLMRILLRLLGMEVFNESIVLATCQNNFSE